MEAQAAAEKLATATQHVQAIVAGHQQQAAAAAAVQQQQQAALAARADSPPPAVRVNGGHENDVPTDLTLDADEKLRLRERFERERRNLISEQQICQQQLQQQQRSSSTSSAEERDREQLDPRPGAFDFRTLIPQVSLKTENY